MTLLIIGLVLWIAPHFFKRLAPNARAKMGAKAKGPIALTLVLAIALMYFGYSSMELIPVYTPLPGMGHLNNLLMVIAVYLSGVGGVKSLLVNKIRHPMLLSAVIWVGAHLLVNGDLASIILFGGMAIWAVGQIILINKAEGAWTRPAPGSMKGEMINIAATIVLVAIIAYIHIWLGHSPFQGTYG